MKKFLIFITTLLSLFIITGNYNVYAASDYNFEVTTKQTNLVHGVKHEAVTGKLTLNNVQSNQVYNYVNLNITENENYQLVGVNAFTDFGYGMIGLDQMIENYEASNPQMEVIAGFNGGFFHIKETGESRNTTIDEYHVLQPMTSPNSTILASHTDGSVSFLDVYPDGYEVIVYNKNNEIKKRLKVDNINKNVLANDKVSLYFDNYNGEIFEWLDPVFVKGTDIKHPANKTPVDNDYYAYAKGVVTQEHQSTVPNRSFVVVSSEINEVIEEDDVIVFQAYIPDFEDVRYGIGTHANFTLVTDGEVNVRPSSSTTVTAQHPRTAVGIDEFGNPFVVVVDGRNPNGGRDGMSFTQLAHLMKEYGAVTSYNFDGGGSSIVMLRNEKEKGSVNERFDVLNELSDGNIRAISNGYLLVKGVLPDKPIEINFPDTRTPFETPQNLYVDSNFYLNFDKETESEKYEVIVNGVSFDIADDRFRLSGLIVGDNHIKVKIQGNSDRKSSEYSDELVIRIYDWQIEQMLELLKNMMLSGMR